MPLCRPLQQAHLYTSIVMARQPVEIVSGGGQQNFAVGLRIKAVLEHTQAKIKALHLFHAGAVALIQAHQHLEHIKVDAQLTDRGARTLALETQQQTGGQVLNEPRLGREVLDLQVKPLHGGKGGSCEWCRDPPAAIAVPDFARDAPAVAAPLPG